MNNFFTGLVKALGLTVLMPVIEQMLLSQAASQGEPAVERAMLLPESTVRAQAVRVGADPDKMVADQRRIAHEHAMWMAELASGPEVVATLAPPVIA